ncbi:DUF6607 family protein [Woodsholea maritima]|uniref:DUF6607 family protein n=1 Tax=Woodsholea maritima TaxID=240237 RepID=UPI001F222535|nr:DUF6607 family protein [Woodsholea maritima]
MMRQSLRIGLVGAVLMVAGCTSVPADLNQGPAVSAARTEAQYEADRQAILAMQGDYAVTFDFTETVAIAEGYELKEPKLSGAREVVWVIADTGDFISLQHALLVGDEDAPFVIKHWRQDWQYQPSQVLAYEGFQTWRVDPVSAAERIGAWSQTVYQVDDSPRYAGVGRWHHGEGAATWQPPVSWRPLPRRDATTRDDYDVIAAVNRHTITPWGWTHEQDNSKLILRTTPHQELVREVGVNTYRKAELVGTFAVEEYWAATAQYWARVRAAFTQLETTSTRFTIHDDAEGTQLYGPLLSLSQEIYFEAKTTDAAWAEAVELLQAQIIQDGHGFVVDVE